MRGLKFLMPAVVLFGLGTAAMPWLQAPEPVVSEAPEWAPPPLPELVLPGAETSYPETLRRPLFRSTRRPVPDAPVVPAPAPAPPQLVGYRLTGIVSTGARRMILLETPGGSSVQLVEGESVDGWTVESIAETAVILSHGETRVDLLGDAEESSAGSGGRNTRWLPAAGQKQ
jgi:hypothetical protein